MAASARGDLSHRTFWPRRHCPALSPNQTTIPGQHLTRAEPDSAASGITSNSYSTKAGQLVGRNFPGWNHVRDGHRHGGRRKRVRLLSQVGRAENAGSRPQGGSLGRRKRRQQTFAGHVIGQRRIDRRRRWTARFIRWKAYGRSFMTDPFQGRWTGSKIRINCERSMPWVRQVRPHGLRPPV